MTQAINTTGVHDKTTHAASKLLRLAWFSLQEGKLQR
jgi:hypothetical protein